MCMFVMIWTLLFLLGLFWVKLLEIVFSHKFHKCFHILEIEHALSHDFESQTVLAGDIIFKETKQFCLVFNFGFCYALQFFSALKTLTYFV